MKKRKAKDYEVIVEKLESAWDNNECDNPKDMIEEAYAWLDEIPAEMTDLRKRLERIAGEAVDNQSSSTSDSELIEGFENPSVLKQFVEDVEDLLKLGRKKEAIDEAKALISVMPHDQKELLQRLQKIVKG